MFRVFLALFWVGLLVGSLLAHNVVMNWAVTLAGLYFLARWWSGRRQKPRVSAAGSPVLAPPPATGPSRLRTWRQLANRDPTGPSIAFTTARAGGVDPPADRFVHADVVANSRPSQVNLAGPEPRSGFLSVGRTKYVHPSYGKL